MQSCSRAIDDEVLRRFGNRIFVELRGRAVFGSANSINTVLTTDSPFSTPKEARSGASFCGSLDNYSIAMPGWYSPSADRERERERVSQPAKKQGGIGKTGRDTARTNKRTAEN